LDVERWAFCSIPESSLVIRHFLYCSSLTLSIQSTGFPFNASRMAICVIAVVGVAPCQCFSPDGIETAPSVSPGERALDRSSEMD
jgi:hypothetical protein